MHDIVELDGRGIPGGMVATVEFQDAAAAQARALGFEPAIVWTPHPIQNRSPKELQAIADEVIEPVLQMICSAESETASHVNWG